MKVNMDSPGKVVIMLLRYEKLLEYCFECRFIGHSMRECVHGTRRGDEGGIIVEESPILAAVDSNHVVESLEVGFPGLKENGEVLGGLNNVVISVEPGVAPLLSHAEGPRAVIEPGVDVNPGGNSVISGRRWKCRAREWFNGDTGMSREGIRGSPIVAVVLRLSFFVPTLRLLLLSSSLCHAVRSSSKGPYFSTRTLVDGAPSTFRPSNSLNDASECFYGRRTVRFSAKSISRGTDHRERTIEKKRERVDQGEEMSDKLYIHLHQCEDIY
ncbi:hypothetical protein ACOSQ2_016622 [Xanthoceras sorbifolium]